MLLVLGFCGEITLTLEFLKFCGEKPPIGEIKHGIIIILWFCKNWRTLGRVLAFSPRVLWYEVPNHQFKCCEVGLNEFHVGFDELL